MAEVRIDEKIARHGQTSTEQFPSSSFYRSIYPRFNSKGSSAHVPPYDMGIFLFIHVTIAIFYFCIKNFSYPYIFTENFVFAREIKEFGVPASLCKKRGDALLLWIGRCLVDECYLSVLSTEIYPPFLQLFLSVSLQNLRLSLRLQYVWRDK